MPNVPLLQAHTIALSELSEKNLNEISAIELSGRKRQLNTEQRDCLNTHLQATG